MSALLALPVSIAYRLVSALAGLLVPLPAGLAAAAAIVAFTIAVRLLLLPLSYRAFRGEQVRARLAPHILELQRRHAAQPGQLGRELAALQAAEGAAPLAGCLPALLQLPFFSVLYRLFLTSTVAGHANLLLRRRLFGTPLGSHLLAWSGPWLAHSLVFGALLALLVLTGWLSARAVRRWASPSAGARPGQLTGTGSPSAISALSRVMPFAPALFAAVVPLAAGLYLLTSTAWTVGERAVLHRLSRGRQPRAAGRAQGTRA